MVRALHKFFDHDVVLASATAGVFVSDAGFVGVCGAVNALAAGEVDRFYDNRECELCNRGFEVCASFGRIRVCDFNGNGMRCRNAEFSCQCTVLVLVMNLEAGRVGVVAGESQLFANVHGRKQSEIVTAGANCLNAFALGEFQHGVFITKVCKNVLVGVRVAQSFAGITRGNHIPAQTLRSLDQRNFGVTATEKQHFLFKTHGVNNISFLCLKNIYFLRYEDSIQQAAVRGART